MKATTLIRVSIGTIMLVYGIHQLLYPAYWFGYVPHIVKQMSPLPEELMLRFHGSANVVLGVLLIAGLWKRITAWISLLWWASIVPLAFIHQWDIGLRDAVITIILGAYIMLISEKSSTKKP